MTARRQTTILLSDEDRAIIEELASLAGLDSVSAAIRMATREALAARKAVHAAPKKKRGR